MNREELQRIDFLSIAATESRPGATLLHMLKPLQVKVPCKIMQADIVESCLVLEPFCELNSAFFLSGTESKSNSLEAFWKFLRQGTSHGCKM